MPAAREANLPLPCFLGLDVGVVASAGWTGVTFALPPSVSSLSGVAKLSKPLSNCSRLASGVFMMLLASALMMLMQSPMLVVYVLM